MNTTEIKEYALKQLKQIKIQILKEVYRILKEGDQHFICEAIRRVYKEMNEDFPEADLMDISKDLDVEVLAKFVNRQILWEAKNNLLDYVREALTGSRYGDDGCLEDWLNEKIPVLKFQEPCGISMCCRLAWIKAMIVSVETGLPVVGNETLIIPPHYDADLDSAL